jgi:hypothetical protein
MAFPVIESVQDNAGQSGTNWGSQTLPSGIAAGDLLIAVVAIDGADETVGFSGGTGGWTKILDGATGSDGTQTMAIAWRVANASDDALSLTNGNEAGGCRIWRISGVDVGGTPLTLGTVTTGTATGGVIDVASCAPGIGAQDFLWLALCSYDRNRTFTSAPTNYQTADGSMDGSGAGGCSLGYGDRNLNAASEDPGDFTWGEQDGATTVLLAIHSGAHERAPDRDQLALTGYVPDIHMPQYDIDHYRFATPIDGAAHEAWTLVGSEDTAYEVALDTGTALIIKIGNRGSAPADTLGLRLQMNVDAAGWVDVTSVSNNVRGAPSGDTNTATSATERLTTSARTFDFSILGENTGKITPAAGAMSGDADIELYYAITFRSADLSGGEQIQFRLDDEAYSLPIPLNITPTANIAGGDMTRQPDKDDLALTGQIPDIALVTDMVTPNQLTLSGKVPTLKFEFFIAVPKGTLTLTGHIPSVEIIHERAPAIDTLVLTGRAATVEITHIRDPPIDSLILTGLAPSVEISLLKAPDADSLTLTGLAPTVEITHTREPANATLNLTGLAPTVEITHVRQPAAGALTLAGKAPKRGAGLRLFGKVPTVEITQTVPMPKGTLTLSGKIPSIEITHVRQPAAGSLALSGKIPSVEKTLKPSPGIDTLILTGRIPSVEITHVRQPAPDSLVITGRIPGVELTKTMQPDRDTLVLSGKIPTVVITPIRSPGKDSLILTGRIPSVEITHIRQPDAGSLVITGQTIDLGGDKTMTPDAGSLALSGKVPSLNVYQPIETPDTGSLTLTGHVPSVEITHVRQPDRDQLLFTGRIPSVEISPVMAPDAGSLTLTGRIPVIDATALQFIPVPVGSLTLTGHIPVANLVSITPDPDNLVITGHAPSVQITHIRQPATASLTITGQSVRFPEIPVATGAMGLFGWAPTRGLGLRLTGYQPSLLIQPIGAITEQPPSGSLTLTGHVPTIAQSGIVADRTPAAGSLLFDGQIPAIVTDIGVPPPSLLFTGHAPAVRYNLGQPAAGSLVLTGHAPIVDTAIEGLPTGSLLLTGQAPTVVVAAGNVDITPATGILEITGRRPFRTQQVEGSGSAQVLLIHEIAASGTSLLKANIELPFQMQIIHDGSTLCPLEGAASITIPFKAIVTGGFGDLKLSTSLIQINGIHIEPPSLYWISDGTHLLGRATIII